MSYIDRIAFVIDFWIPTFSSLIIFCTFFLSSLKNTSRRFDYLINHVTEQALGLLTFLTLFAHLLLAPNYPSLSVLKLPWSRQFKFSCFYSVEFQIVAYVENFLMGAEEENINFLFML